MDDVDDAGWSLDDVEWALRGAEWALGAIISLWDTVEDWWDGLGLDDAKDDEG